MEASKGSILISEPFLQDPNFQRSVVLITEHNEEGTHGFVINQPTVLTVQELFPEFECGETVFLGGPVARNTFHFLHTLSQLDGAVEVLPGLYWSGDFEMLKFMYRENLLEGEKVRFLAGYSGWAAGQLDGELTEKAWIVAPGKAEYAFSSDAELWKHILAGLGGQFQWLSNAPEDVRLN